MSVILEMVAKYLKLNPKRTGIAVGSMILCVFLLTLASNIFVWGFHYMRRVEEEISGSWQVRYQNVTSEQAEKLKERTEFSKCTSSPIKDEVYEVDVELQKINEDIFELTQKIGGEIGMSTLEGLGTSDYLPNGEKVVYDISYHMELLDFYGVTYENNTSMKQILLGVLGIIMGIAALLIYSVFSLSFLEKKKYLGLLSCVGASLWQRRMFILGEGVLIGIVSIPAGVALGAVSMIPLTSRLQDWLNGNYGLQMNLPIMPDIKVTLLSALLGVLTIVVAVAVPTIQAGWVNPLELIFHAGETELGEVGGKYHPNCSLEFNMAFRNIRSNQKRFTKMMVFGIAAIIVAFNGYLSIQEMKGTYLLEDEREKAPLDAWIRIYSDDFTLGERAKEKIQETSWCKDSSYLSVLDMGVFIVDKKYVANDLEKFFISWHNIANPTRFEEEEKKEHYGFPLKVIGVDDDIYRDVVRQYEPGGENEWRELTEQGVYPVLLDDSVPVKKNGENYSSYRNVLSVSQGENLPIQYGRYGDYLINSSRVEDSVIYRTKDANTTLHVSGVLSERFPIPVVPGAYGLDADDYTQMESYYIRCYMPYSVFSQFLCDAQVEKTYGVLESEAMEHLIAPREENPVISFVCMNRLMETKESVVEKDISQIMNTLKLRPFRSGVNDEEYINAANLWEYGNVENWKRMQMMKNAGEILKRIFMIGAILLVLFFTVFSLVSYLAASIYVRRRELSVLKSMGMGYKNLRKMLLYENMILLGATAILGTVMSWFIAYGQLRQIRGGSATVKVDFPFGIYAGILGIAFLLTGGIVLFMVRRVRNVNILDALKNENE